MQGTIYASLNANIEEVYSTIWIHKRYLSGFRMDERELKLNF